MIKDLVIPREKIQYSDYGSYVIDRMHLVSVDLDVLKSLEYIINVLVEENPEYEFVSETLYDGSVRIRWRRNKAIDAAKD